MSSVKLLLFFFIFTLITKVQTRRLHFEDDQKQTSSTPEQVSTSQTNSSSIGNTNKSINVDQKTQKTIVQNKENLTKQEPVLNNTKTQTKQKISIIVTGTRSQQTQNTRSQTNITQATKTQDNVITVPIADLPTFTTKQLTLNLSNLKFPNPKPQGDNLNLSGIIISTSSSSSSNSTKDKCKHGYILSTDGRNCYLADILLQINLDAQNLVIGDLNFQDLKAKQIQFKNKNQQFTPIQCSNQAPFLSKQGCITCKAPNSLFSLKSLKCSKCPEGSIFNSQTKNCESVPQIFVSNLNANKFLILPGESLNNYKNQIQESQKQNPNIQVCPLQKPYSVGSECVSCPNQKPLFFISSRSCTSCQVNSTYDTNIHSCVGKKYKITTITRTSTKKQQRNRKQQDSSSSSDKKNKKEQDSSSSSNKKKTRKNNQNEQNDK